MTSSSDGVPTYRAKLLSPFRYPGGKTWLVPLVCRWLHGMKPEPTAFIEPFAGGGIVGLNVAFRQLAQHVTFVELDEDVAAVWHVIVNGDAKRFADRVCGFEFNLSSVKETLADNPRSLEERAFRTILRNRVNRAGILADGAGMLRKGEDGKGIRSRWYPETLKRRILQIEKVRERLTFIEGDGLDVLRQYENRSRETWMFLVRSLIGLIRSVFPRLVSPMDSGRVVFFIDPPYTAGSKKPGRRLYKHHDLDHEELFRVASTLNGDFLMTYSSDQRIRELASKYDFDTYEVAMRSSHHAKISELLIGRDLSWAK